MCGTAGDPRTKRKGNIGSDEYYAPAKIAEQFYRLYTEKKETEITY